MDGNCSQLTGVHGFLITTRTISGADIWKDLPGWTKKSSRKRIELGDALSGAYFERIYPGYLIDLPRRVPKAAPEPVFDSVLSALRFELPIAG